MKRISDFKSSFLYRLILYFVFMIIIPVLLSWIAYEKVLNYFYFNNAVANQQVNMEKSLSLLDSSLDTASNVFVAIRGISDVTYYLDFDSAKSNMFYGSFRDICEFTDELNTMEPYLSSVKIYCDSPLVIYAVPFRKIRDLEMTLEEEEFEAIEDAGFQETIWFLEMPEGESFPVIYGYQKVYSRDYNRCTGYMEVKLSSQIFADYFDVLRELSDDPESTLSLYYGGRLLYTVSGTGDSRTSVEEKIPEVLEKTASGYEFNLWNNSYRNCLVMSEWDLCIVHSGRMLDQSIMPSGNIPSIFISIIILLLLVLFLLFFMNVMSLSRRILAFSSFIRKSDPEQLLPFRPEKRKSGGEDEIDSLINTYNSLIQENDSLISKIEKMELYTKDARFQALRGQIHPHFIYGTLENIRFQALQDGSEESAAMIYSLSTLLRYSISISSKSVTLEDEVEIAQHYLQLQKSRFGERIEYTFQIEEQLLPFAMPSFILQPILENAIIYGIAPTLDHCALRVEAYKEETRVVLRVSNTGLPITPQRLKEVNDLLSGSISLEDFHGNRNGQALYNIRERIAIFFDGKARIQLECQDNCTSTSITIEI